MYTERNVDIPQVLDARAAADKDEAARRCWRMHQTCVTSGGGGELQLGGEREEDAEARSKREEGTSK